MVIARSTVQGVQHLVVEAQVGCLQAEDRAMRPHAITGACGWRDHQQVSRKEAQTAHHNVDALCPFRLLQQEAPLLISPSDCYASYRENKGEP